MSYLEKKVLTIDEEIKVAPKNSKALLILKLIWGVAGFWLIFIPTFKAISALIKYKTTEYLVSDKRIMKKTGWISTRSNDMNLDKIEKITVSYTFWGKIFKYGTVSFQGASWNIIHFNNVKNPEAIKKQINELF